MPHPTVPGDRPKLAPGVELIGEYQGSGFKETPYIGRRGDGQVIQLSRLLYLTAAALDGERDTSEVARVVSESFDRRVKAEHVEFLLDSKLRPAGLVSGGLAEAARPRGEDPLLALRHRKSVVPPSVVQAIARVCRFLFTPTLIGAAIAWLLTFDAWLFHHGFTAGVFEIVRQPILILALLALVLVATAWHEIGHASACRYGGATPGAIGVGIYLVWPAFYTDVTDAYRLDRPGRLRTDLGGIYFNVLFILAVAGAYLATGFEPLLVLIVLQHVQILQQLPPFVRFDGYYVLTDLVGVPDLLSRVKAMFRGLLPGGNGDDALRDLKPWVRAVTVVYLVALVAVLGSVYTLLAMHAPALVAAARHSFFLHLHQVSAALDAHSWVLAAIAGIETAAVILPVVAVTLGIARVANVLVIRPLRRDAVTRSVRGETIVMAPHAHNAPWPWLSVSKRSWRPTLTGALAPTRVPRRRQRRAAEPPPRQGERWARERLYPPGGTWERARPALGDPRSPLENAARGPAGSHSFPMQRPRKQTRRNHDQ